MIRTDNLALSNEESQLVLGFLGKLAQLHAVHFTSNLGADFIELCLALREEVAEGRVRVFAMVIVLEWLKRSISTIHQHVSVQYHCKRGHSPLCLIIPDGKVVGKRCGRLLARSLDLVFVDIGRLVSNDVLLVGARVVLELGNGRCTDRKAFNGCGCHFIGVNDQS